MKGIPSCFLIILVLLLLLATACATTPPPDMRLAGEIMQEYDGSAAVKYTLPGMEDVLVANVEYKDGLNMDIYYPPDFDFRSTAPVVVFPLSYADEQIYQWFGLDKLKNMEPYVTWGPLLGVSGMIAVTYETDYPYDDFHDVMNFIFERSEEYGFDRTNIGIWACSSNPLIALEILSDKHHEWGENVKCGVLYYPFIQHFMEPSGANAPVIKTLKKRLRSDVPLYIVKAGQDDPVQNEALDMFVDMARDQEAPLEYVDFEDAPHGFDVYYDTERTKEIIKYTLDFYKLHLGLSG